MAKAWAKFIFVRAINIRHDFDQIIFDLADRFLRLGGEVLVHPLIFGFGPASQLLLENPCLNRFCLLAIREFVRPSVVLQ